MTDEQVSCVYRGDSITVFKGPGGEVAAWSMGPYWVTFKAGCGESSYPKDDREHAERVAAERAKGEEK